MTLLETYRRTAGSTRLGVPLVDEAVEDGRAAGAAGPGWRGTYAGVVDGWPTPAALAGTAARLDGTRVADGVVFTATVDGVDVEQPFPLDVLPRVVPADEWRHLAEGVVQRTRALEAFLGDVYGARDGRPPAVVADGVVPAWVVTESPGLRARGPQWAAPGVPRITVSGLDLLKDGDGPWRVLEDNLRIPSGMGYAIANRAGVAAAEPGLLERAPAMLEPSEAPALLLEGLLALAPPRCRRAVPSVVVLSDGPGNSAWFEHVLLAAGMGVPVVTPADLGVDGSGVRARTATGDVPVDVLYRRTDEDALGGLRGLEGTPLDDLLLRAVRAGRLSVANAPGNGVADDKATYAYVPAMVRYYLGEEPVLDDVRTWVLADPEMLADALPRLAELVVKPVDGYGGLGVVFGPLLDERGLADLRAEVEAGPHRFVAQQPVTFTTHPTLCGEALAPRHVDLRVFALGTADPLRPVVSPAPLTRVALREGSLVVNSSAGGGSKDTWVLTDG